MIRYIACKNCEYEALKTSWPFMDHLFSHFFKYVVSYDNSDVLKIVMEV
jgi:hypothetical protein